ncbi:MAG: ABC transporter permease [Chloroflexi bacterium]|nr:ABC transporter permease [Chloroflexota bacterium]
MNLVESIRVALHSLSANKMRAGLTMLGIIIGVGAVIALVSIGEGAQAAITEQIQGIGSNLIFVLPGRLVPGRVSSFGTAASAILTLEDAEAIADPTNCPDVYAVAPELSRSGTVVFRNQNSNTTVSGTTPAALFVRRLSIRDGNFFTEQDLLSGARVAVLGGRLAQEMFAGENPLDQTIRVNRVPFRVIGVLEERGGGGHGGGGVDTSVFVPITTAQNRLFGDITSSRGRRVTLIYASAVSEERVDAAIEQITYLLRQRHKIRFAEEDDFTVTSQKDILGVLDQVTSILTLFLGAVAAISLLVGGIGIMNIMLVSVTERTREIGIRKAVGAKRRDILVQFVIEAVVLSVIGGLLGIIFGVLAAAMVNRTGVLVTRVSPNAVFLAVGFSVAVGLFFGIYPATRAARLNPIEALRYE